MHASARQPDPLRNPAIACGALLGLALVLATFGPRADLPIADAAHPADATLRLSFADGVDGLVIASDADTGMELARYGIGEGGFVRTTMRGLARERLRRGIGAEPPFVLARLETGRLVLSDPQTGKSIGLDAFGDANAAAFGAFLDHGREPQ